VSTPALFLLDPLPPGDVIVLDGDEGRHAARVKRVRHGETVLIGDGRGALVSCVAESVGADRLTARVVDRRVVPMPDPRLVVVQALPKGERAELAVELLTELGADEIVPWAAARSVVQWSGERAAKALTRWRRVAVEAAKQSRRPWVPVVAELASTSEVVARARGALVLHEGAALALTGAVLPVGCDIILVVGPEGGIATDELAAFTTAGAVPVRLGEPVLRTSTAGAAALAVLSVRIGRW
jgi:16S rRNA (uracil1498-N3)-methyltransferase